MLPAPGSVVTTRETSGGLVRDREGGLDPPALASLRIVSRGGDGAALVFGCEAPPVQRGEGERLSITALAWEARPVCLADGGVQGRAGVAEPVHAGEREHAVEVSPGLQTLNRVEDVMLLYNRSRGSGMFLIFGMDPFMSIRDDLELVRVLSPLGISIPGLMETTLLEKEIRGG